MRTNTVRTRLWLSVGVAATTAIVAATGALGGSSGGTITTIAGTGKPGFAGDGGPATSARLSGPIGVAVDAKGNAYVVDAQNRRVRMVRPGGTITTIAGTGTGFVGGDGGPATSAVLGVPKDVAVDGDGNMYITDGHTVRKVTSDGTITTIAGTWGRWGFSGDGGPATAALLNTPNGVAVDRQGNVYIADWGNSRVRKINRGGTITTIAGSGKYPSPLGDGGPATSARVSNPEDVAVDRQGNVYITMGSDYLVRKVTRGGKITTIAGGGPLAYPGYGDGGPARSAKLFHPTGVAVDGQGNVYFADMFNHRVRKVSRAGKITTIAGTWPPGFSGDGGPASKAKLKAPWGVAVDRKGSVYIADTQNSRVRRVTVRP